MASEILTWQKIRKQECFLTWQKMRIQDCLFLPGRKCGYKNVYFELVENAETRMFILTWQKMRIQDIYTSHLTGGFLCSRDIQKTIMSRKLKKNSIYKKILVNNQLECYNMYVAMTEKNIFKQSLSFFRLQSSFFSK